MFRRDQQRQYTKAELDEMARLLRRLKPESRVLDFYRATRRERRDT